MAPIWSGVGRRMWRCFVLVHGHDLGLRNLNHLRVQGRIQDRRQLQPARATILRQARARARLSTCTAATVELERSKRPHTSCNCPGHPPVPPAFGLLEFRRALTLLKCRAESLTWLFGPCRALSRGVAGRTKFVVPVAKGHGDTPAPADEGNRPAHQELPPRYGRWRALVARSLSPWRT